MKTDRLLRIKLAALGYGTEQWGVVVGTHRNTTELNPAWARHRLRAAYYAKTADLPPRHSDDDLKSWAVSRLAYCCVLCVPTYLSAVPRDEPPQQSRKSVNLVTTVYCDVLLFQKESDARTRLSRRTIRGVGLGADRGAPTGQGKLPRVQQRRKWSPPPIAVLDDINPQLFGRQFCDNFWVGNGRGRAAKRQLWADNPRCAHSWPLPVACAHWPCALFAKSREKLSKQRFFFFDTDLISGGVL